MPRPAKWNCVYLSADRPPQLQARGHLDTTGQWLADPTPSSAPLVALVPADRCNVISIELPELSGRKLTQALRWAAEEHIAGPVEDQHVSPIRREPDGRLRCVVTTRAAMEAWLQVLPERPRRILPDAACLPWAEGQISIAPIGQQWLLRWGETEFDRVDEAMLELLLTELISTGDHATEVICYQSDPMQALPPAVAELKPGVEAIPDSLIGLLATQAVATPINLMHGEFAAVEPGTQLKAWRWSLAAGCSLLLLAGLYTASEHWLLKQQSRQLEQDIVAQFQRVFPEITRPVRPRIQAEQAMAALSGSGSDAMLALSSRVSQLIGGADGIRMDSLSFRDQRLRLSMNIPGSEDIELLQQRLRLNGLDVAVEELQVQSEGARVTLLISAGSR